MIRLRGVRIDPPAGRPDRAPLLDIADLSISFGEYVGLVGANGAGKSLLVQAIAGLKRPSGGRVAFDSQDGTVPSIGLLFQSPDDQIVGSTVERDVAFGLENRMVPAPEMRRRVDEALAAGGLADLAKRAPHLLSDGEKQRVSLASVLVLEPSVLLLDEPTARLDPEARRLFLARIREVRARTAATVVHVTHRADELSAADRIVGLEGGRVVFDGTPAALLGTPAARALGVIAPRDPAPPPAASARATDPLVRLCDVRWTADDGAGSRREVLRGVDLEIRRGERVGLVGRSGSGKTTLASIVAGLLEASSGRVEWTDRAAAGGEGARAPAALAFQEPEAGFFEETVLADVAFGPRNLGLSEEEAAERAAAALRRAGLDPDVFGARAPETLSGGEARRAAIAGVLALDARLLVLDEPGTGLDADGLERLHEALAGLRRDDVALLLISHDVPFLLAECDRIALLDEGRIAWDGPARRAAVELPPPWRSAGVAGTSSPSAAAEAAQDRAGSGG
jgi:energy-coupling factor transport system ATP-binding protein